MKANQKLHDLGQSLWIDHIARDLLNSSMLKHYIEELSVTGPTSNPAIFGYSVKNSSAYDAAIRKKLRENKSGEELFLELALGVRIQCRCPAATPSVGRHGIQGSIGPGRFLHQRSGSATYG